MKKLRVILESDNRDPFYNLAMDEALTRLRLSGDIDDTLRFWKISPSIIVGYFQRINDAVNMTYCQKYNIKVLRRPSSGGAVYCDEGVFLFSLIIDVNNWPGEVRYPRFSYYYLTKPIISALRDFGINVSFTFPNIITVNNKKVSGMSQFYLYNVLLLHGTLLINPNFVHLVKSLKNPAVPIKNNLVPPFEGLITLNSILPNVCNSYVFVKLPYLISSHFGKLFERETYFKSFSNNERKLASNLKINKYSTKPWIENKAIITSIKI